MKKPLIMYGKPVADVYSEHIAKRIAQRTAVGKKTTLAIVMVGDNGPSLAYLKRIVKLTESLGGTVRVCAFPSTVSQDEVLSCVSRLNRSRTVQGIMPLFPMPEQINDEVIANAVLPAKDLDCVNSLSVGRFYAGQSPWAPATARACMALLHYYNIPLDGKFAVVLGRSNVVGKPVAYMLMAENATICVCHSHSKNIAEICAKADILVSAVGKPGIVTPEMIKNGAVLVDVGINVTERGIVGDIAPECYPKSGAYSPVPGGIGTVCNMMLLQCLVEK